MKLLVKMKNVLFYRKKVTCFGQLNKIDIQGQVVIPSRLQVNQTT